LYSSVAFKRNCQLVIKDVAASVEIILCLYITSHFNVIPLLAIDSHPLYLSLLAKELFYTLAFARWSSGSSWHY